MSLLTVTVIVFYGLLIWLVVFAAFTSMLMFKFNNDRDKDQQLKYAQFLAKERDSIAEIKISRLTANLESVISGGFIFDQSSFDDQSYSSISKKLIELFRMDNYLSNGYDLFIVKEHIPGSK